MDITPPIITVPGGTAVQAGSIPIGAMSLVPVSSAGYTDAGAGGGGGRHTRHVQVMVVVVAMVASPRMQPLTSHPNLYQMNHKCYPNPDYGI